MNFYFCRAKITTKMTPSRAHTDIIWLDEADSTNSEARRRFGSLDNLSIIAARSQSSGRGQGDHTWHSTPGLNLTFSVFMRFGKLPASEASAISCAVCLALLDYLSGKGVSAAVKWPNDIWVGKKKISGILIENRIDGGLVKDSVIGVGFNLNEVNWPEDLPNPVSLKELTGVEYDVEEELMALEKAIRRRFTSIGSADGRMSLQEEFGKVVFRLP